VKGGLVTVGSQALVLLAKVSGIVVLGRLLAPETFGIVAIATAFASLSSAVIYMGLPMAVLQAGGVSEGARSFFFALNAGLGMFLAILFVAAGGWVSTIYGEPDLKLAMWIMASVPLLSGLQAQSRTVLMERLEYGKVAASDVTGQVIGTAGAIGLALSGATVVAVAALPAVAVLTQGLLVAWLARWAPGVPRGSSGDVRPIMFVALKIFATSLIRDVSRSSIVPVMGVSVSTSAIGAFDRAQQIAVMPINLSVDQLQRVVVPVLTRLREQKHEFLRYFEASVLVTAYATASAYFLVAVYGGELVALLLGPEWEVAGQLLRILAVGAVFRALAQCTQWIFIAGGASGAGLRSTLYGHPVIAAASLAAIPWGVTGVATANAAAWAVYWPIVTLAAARALDLEFARLMAGPLRGALGVAAPIAIYAGAASVFLSGFVEAAFIIALGLLHVFVSFVFSKGVAKDLGTLRLAAELAVSRRAG
jgi:PST family polysaccharide transporter